MALTTQINQVGAREDLADIIAVADMKSTPLSTRIPKGSKPTNMLFSYQADAYAAAKAGGVPDGTDVTTSDHENAAANRKKLDARCEVFRRTPRVGFIAEDVQNVAGVASEFAKAKAKKVIELKRDIETELLSAQESAADNGTTGSKTRGLGKWIQNGAQTDLPVDASFRTPTASIYSAAMADFDELDLRALLQSRFEQVGVADNLLMLAGTEVRNAINDFARYIPNKTGSTIVRTFDQGRSSTINSTIDIYEGDYGTVEIVTSLFVPNTKTAYIIDMGFAELRTHTAPNFKPLPDNGGGPIGLIQAIVGLAVTNPLAHCKISAT